MNKRDLVLATLDREHDADYVPAGFFLHFDPQYHRGQPAIEKHLEFFHYTEMDFVKIQFEHTLPRQTNLLNPDDWRRIKPLDEEFFLDPLYVVDGLVKAAKREALVLVTLYSPFMLAGQINGQETITRHIIENPEKAKIGMEIVTESLLAFVKACIRLGVDGFYTSTQGAETFRFDNFAPFLECVKPYDLAVMDIVNTSCDFNILHVCDYHGGYHDLGPVLDYLGQIVNCSLHIGGVDITGKEASRLFNRPFMGGLERKGVIANGTSEEIKETVKKAISSSPANYILGADCTVPGDTSWENLRTAIREAHEFKEKTGDD
jgi:uroporphyrinogen decarboxylase